jgi:septum formation inhibitor-activating ATPase MinD
LMVGAGISATFDADKLLGIIFSKKMRAKARNAKEADAWKSY